MKRNDLIGSLEKLGWYLEIETFGRAPYELGAQGLVDQWHVATRKTVPVQSATPRIRIEDIQAAVYASAPSLPEARGILLARVKEWEDLA